MRHIQFDINIRVLGLKANAEEVPKLPSATTCFSCSPPDYN
jgi:hypothetical protein